MTSGILCRRCHTNRRASLSLSILDESVSRQMRVSMGLCLRFWMYCFSKELCLPAVSRCSLSLSLSRSLALSLSRSLALSLTRFLSLTLSLAIAICHQYRFMCEMCQTPKNSTVSSTLEEQKSLEQPLATNSIADMAIQCILPCCGNTVCRECVAGSVMMQIHASSNSLVICPCTAFSFSSSFQVYFDLSFGLYLGNS